MRRQSSARRFFIAGVERELRSQANWVPPSVETLSIISISTRLNLTRATNVKFKDAERSSSVGLTTLDLFSGSQQSAHLSFSNHCQCVTPTLPNCDTKGARLRQRGNWEESSQSALRRYTFTLCGCYRPPENFSAVTIGKKKFREGHLSAYIHFAVWLSTEVYMQGVFQIQIK